MTIFSIFSALMAALSIGYAILLLHRSSKKLGEVQGIMVSLGIGTMAGLLTGFLIGVQSGDMFLTSGVSMIAGFIIGFLAGQPSGLMALLGGALAGIIGGVAGTFLGIMLQFTSPVIMLSLLLAIFIIIVGLVILFIFVETSEKLTIDTRGISPFAILSAGVALLAIFLFLYSSDLVKIPGKTAAAQQVNTSGQSTDIVEADVSKDKAPIVKMKVTPTGYTPNVIRVKKGIHVQLVIDNPLDNSSCLSTFTIPDFNINNVNLKTGETNLSFTPEKSGKYTFSCGMQMYKGTIIVE